MDIASGKYVIFIDSDDYVDLDYVEKMFTNITKSGADICIGGFTKISDSGNIEIHKNPLAGMSFTDLQIRQLVIPKICGQLKENDSIGMSVWIAIYRRDIIEKNSIRFPSERELISEDLIFNFEILSQSSKVMMIDTVGYYYRYNPASLSHRYLPERFQKQKQMFLAIEEMAEKIGIYDLCHQRNMNTFIGWARGHIKSEQAEWKRIGFLKSISNIRKICYDPVLQKAMMEFDDSYLPKRSKIVNKLISMRAVFLLWCFSWLVNTLKGSK